MLPKNKAGCAAGKTFPLTGDGILYRQRLPVKKSTPNLTHLLNKVEAMLASKAGTMAELVIALNSSQPRVHEWVMGRKYEPGGEITERMNKWLHMKHEEFVAAGDDSPQREYAKHFARISKEHPTET